MREALAARSDRDFVSAGPSRRAQRPPPRHEDGVPALVLRILGAAFRHPGRVVATLAISAASAAVTLNALSYQTAKHPAPLFSDRPARPEITAPRRPEPVVPAPPMRPVELAPTTTQGLAPPPPRPATRDPIGDLLRGTDVPRAAPAKAPPPAAEPARPSESVKAEPSRLVGSAQRALAKLGYGPLKVDGVMGPGTRQAIERFERERKLTVTGELGPRTVRELAAAAGQPVE